MKKCINCSSNMELKNIVIKLMKKISKDKKILYKTEIRFNDGSQYKGHVKNM